MRRQFFLLNLLLFIGTFSPTWAASTALLLRESHPQGLTLEFNLPFLKKTTVQHADNTCDSLQMVDWMQTIETGYPELPTTGTLIQVPATGEITVRLVESQAEILQNFTPCPVLQPTLSPQGDIIQKSTSLNTLQEPYPAEIIKLGARAIWRNVPVVRLGVTPFQWNPSTQELSYFKYLKIQIQFRDTLLPQLRNRQSAEIYENLLQQTVINYSPVSTDNNNLRKRVEPPVVAETSVSKKPRVSDTLRLEITKIGIYRVFFADLVNAGLQPHSIRPDQFSLSTQGQEVAIKVVTAAPDTFADGDYIEFYGQGINTSFTDANVYWLNWRKKDIPKRITQRDGQLTEGGQSVTEFYDHLRVEKNGKLWEQTPDAPRTDYWFWAYLTSPDDRSSGVYDNEMTIPTPAANSPEAALRVNFRGHSDTPHHTQIALNGTTLSDESWEGLAEYTQTTTAAAQLFGETNTLTITLPGDVAEKESIYLNWVEIDYWRRFEAVKDSLTFTLAREGKTRVTVNNFSKSDLIVYDITDPYEISEIKNFVTEKNEKLYNLTFEDTLSGEKKYHITTAAQVKQPSALVLWQPSHLQSLKNGADYILITADEFLPAVKPLTDLRRRQGLRVKTVSVEEIYDEFNGGLIDPAAIKNFLQFAYENWQRPAPTYVFLVGDATVDYRGYLKAKKKSRVPAHLLDNEGFQYIMAPSDNWYVSVQGDDVLPEMLIGRIPGENVDAVATTIGKIVRFEESNHESPHKILLVADSEEKFHNLHEQVIVPLIPNMFTLEKIYLALYFESVKTTEEKDQKVAEARQALIDSINAGVMITTYYGHGTSMDWSLRNRLFSTKNIESITNDQQLTFLLTMSCINGHFTRYDNYSLAEQFIAFPKGIIAGLLPSNLSYASEDVILAKEIFSTLFAQETSPLGAVTTQAKIAAYQQGTSEELVGIFTFFGDPATKLKKW